MADNKAYEKALKDLDKLLKKQEAINKSTDVLKDSWTAISSQLFSIDGAQFFKQIPRSAEDLKELTGEVKKLNDTFVTAGNEFAKIINKDIAKTNLYKVAKSIQKELGSAFTSSKEKAEQELKSYMDAVNALGMGSTVNEEKIKDLMSGKLKDQDSLLYKLREQQVYQDRQIENFKRNEQSQERINDTLKKLKDKYKELHSISDQDLVNLGEILKKNGKNLKTAKEWEAISSKLNSEQRKLLALLHEDGDALLVLNHSMDKAVTASAKIKEKMLQPKDVFSLSKSFEAFGKNMRKDLVASLMSFDATLHDVQKNTGVMMVENSRSFSEMTTRVAQFGMSVGEAGKMIADMGEELHTTDLSILSKTTEDLSMIGGATGALSEDITIIAGQMMRMGSSSEQVKDMFQDTSNIAKKFGVSSKGVISDISRNLGKWKNAGFQGGEKGLAKMVAMAKRLNVSVDSIFAMAEKGRSIEGAMDMSAQLQLVGGSFANADPMGILAASIKGPKEVLKMMSKMGKDIGKFNEKGEFEIDFVDSQRLKMAAEAMSVSVDDLRNNIEKTAMDGKKLAGISENVFSNAAKGVEGWDADMAKSSLSDMLEMGKNGEINIKTKSVDLFEQAGITDLKNITEKQMTDLLGLKDKEKKTLEEENRLNQDLKQSFDNFMRSFMNALNIFQPALEGIGWVFQKLSEAFNLLPEMGKSLVSGLLVFGIMFGTSVGAFITQGIMGFIKGTAGFAKSTLGFIKNVATGNAFGAAGAGAPAAAGAGAGNLTKAGVPDRRFKANKLGGAKIPGGDMAANSKGMTGGIGKSIQEFMRGLAKGLAYFANPKTIGGIAVLVISAVALAGALYLIGKIMAEVPIVALVTFGLAIIGLAQSMMIMSKIAKKISVAGIVNFGVAMITFSISFSSAMIILFPAIAILVGAMIGLGFAFKLVGEGLGAMAPGITAILNGVGTVIKDVGTAISTVMSTMADSIVKLSNINAMNLFAVAAGIGALSLAMIAFGASSMIGGVMSFFGGGGMISQLSELALLAPAIKILGDSLTSAGDGLAKLSAAAESLSLDKLEKLKELGDSFANSNGGAAMAALANSGSSAGGAGGGEKTINVEIDLKLNGKMIEKILTSGKIGSSYDL